MICSNALLVGAHRELLRREQVMVGALFEFLSLGSDSIEPRTCTEQLLCSDETARRLVGRFSGWPAASQCSREAFESFCQSIDQVNFNQLIDTMETVEKSRPRTEPRRKCLCLPILF